MMTASADKKRIAILISGRGSNMMSLVEAMAAPEFPAEAVVVISNRPEAAGLAWAENRGIESLAIDHKSYPSREAFEAKLHEELSRRQIDIVCLAGFMRLLTAAFVDKWLGRMLNIHPSLLPAFRGLDTHQQAIDAGVKIAGCTVHLVVPEMDAGPIIAQAAVAVHENDSADTLAARILRAEHKIYPHALHLIASGRGQPHENKVLIERSVNQGDELFSPPLANPS
ncbi:MAG: hypothetical protein RLZ98_2116 [Pseudomonadota bacterium]|jgi:phosphoribosylglycinamide formyltransferase-1